MIIRIERSGGVSGIPLQKTINSNALSKNKTEEIHTIIEKTNFFHLSSQYTESNVRDTFQYTITVQAESHTHSVTFDEDRLPKELHPLIKSFT